MLHAHFGTSDGLEGPLRDPDSELPNVDPWNSNSFCMFIQGKLILGIGCQSHRHYIDGSLSLGSAVALKGSPHGVGTSIGSGEY